MPNKIKLDGFVAQRIFNTPLLLEPNKARVISNYLEKRLFGNFSVEKLAFFDGDEEDDDKQVSNIVEGVAIIPIIGTLVQRGGWMDASSGMLSYQVLRQQMIDAANNPSVKSILLDIDSGGGEVEGNFDLARLIREINNDHKPVVAIANGSAFSGAFSLGVSAGSFFVTETGGVGSVGVIIQHVDVSKNNEMNGIKVTNIVAGDRKAELSPDFPLSKSGKELLQKEVDRVGGMFVSLVAEMRNISENVVKGTEAALLFGDESLKIDFVDGIISFDSLLEQMININSNKDVLGMKQRINEMFLKKKNESAKIEDKSAEDKPVEVTKTEDKPAEDKPVETAEVETSAADDVLERAAQIADVCCKGGMSSMASEFIRSGLTVEQVQEKVDFNEEVLKACTLAGKKELSKSYIDSGKTLKQIQDDLISKMSAEQKDISNKQTAESAKEDVKTAKNVIEADIERREKLNKQKGVK